MVSWHTKCAAGAGLLLLLHQQPFAAAAPSFDHEALDLVRREAAAYDGDEAFGETASLSNRLSATMPTDG